MSYPPPTNSADSGVPKNRPQLSPNDLHCLRAWHESSNIQQASNKAEIEIRTMENKLRNIRRRLGVQDDAELREYVNRNGYPEPIPPPPEPPPLAPAYLELLAQRKLARERLELLADPYPSNLQKLGLDPDLLHADPDAYHREWFKWSEVWPGGKFLPQSPDETLLALLVRRTFREIEESESNLSLLITLDSAGVELDAEARGRIFWALELEPTFPYSWTKDGIDPSLARRPSPVDPRYLPGGSEFPRRLTRYLRRTIYTTAPYVFPDGSQRPFFKHVTAPSGPGPHPPPPWHSRFSFSIEQWAGPNEVTVSVDLEHGPLCGHGSRETLTRNGDSWRSVKRICSWVS